MKGRSYTVRGILDSDEALMMIQEQGENIFPYLELTYENQRCTASNTKATLEQWGLTDYVSFTEGNLYAGLGRILAGLPIVLLLLTVIITSARRLGREKAGLPHYMVTGVYMAVFLLVIVLFVKFGIVFSEDYIPGKVSDFEFRPDKIKAVGRDYQGMLIYGNWLKEKVIIKCLNYSFITSAASVILWIAARLREKI